MVHGYVCLALSNLLGGKLGNHTVRPVGDLRDAAAQLRDAKAARRTLAPASPQRPPHRTFNRIGGLP
jgi:hypothetical protein